MEALPGSDLGRKRENREKRRERCGVEAACRLQQGWRPPPTPNVLGSLLHQSAESRSIREVTAEDSVLAPSWVRTGCEATKGDSVRAESPCWGLGSRMLAVALVCAHEAEWRLAGSLYLGWGPVSEVSCPSPPPVIPALEEETPEGFLGR